MNTLKYYYINPTNFKFFLSESNHHYNQTITKTKLLI